MSALPVARRPCNYVDRPLSSKPIAWSGVQKECILDAYETLKAISPPFARGFSKALQDPAKISLLWFELDSFDKEVGNHFPNSRLQRSCQLVSRKGTIRYALFADRVSLIIVAKVNNTFLLLDGNHRSLAAAIAHSRIAALVIQL